MSAESRALADALEAYAARHGLARWRLSVLLFKGCRCGILKLRNTNRPSKAVLDRVRAFLASPPPPGLHRRPLGGKRIRRDTTTGAWLADIVDALIAEHGLSPRRVALHLFNSPHGLQRLREKKPHGRTVARVQAFLAAPDLERMREPPPKRVVTRPARVVVSIPRKPRRHLSFDEQLRRVLAGEARIVEKVRLPTREHSFTLGGVSAGMLG